VGFAFYSIEFLNSITAEAGGLISRGPNLNLDLDSEIFKLFFPSTNDYYQHLPLIVALFLHFKALRH